MLSKITALGCFAGTLLVLPGTAGEATSAKASEKSSVASDIPLQLTPEVPQPPKWGVQMSYRYAHTPFKAGSQNVDGVVPLFYYEGERFFLRGVEGGAHLWNNEQIEIDTFLRYRFFDYPEIYEDSLDHDTFDAGLRASWRLNESSRIAAEILTDFDGRVHGAARWEADHYHDRWWFHPFVEARLKTSNFNSRYYGLGLDDVDAGFDVKVGVKSRYHIWRNLYAEGSVEARWLDGNTTDSDLVEDSMEYAGMIGLGFYEAPYPHSAKSPARSLNAKPYFRVAQGWGTDSSLAQILEGDIRTDKGADVNMTSIFYGHPLSDTLFGLPLEVYLTTGLIHHWSSDVQGSATEYVMGLKVYYTVPTPWRVRLGVAEGVSYIDSYTYYEENSLIDKGYDPSRLLNYLDFTIDLNLGDVFGANKIEDLWLGYGIHHRSGIFEASPTFGNVSGGSNFNTLYLQWSGKF
ncbi:MipA/OmpV family protein [Verrucomicrobiaceae bacterium N1E253]|uniref:MipA/OmpV family protein n=1 Tax=Oceaniferula marina TaxID=2748318 RepID=A0A851GGS3_9BACT|nr:MipA/OmpV family protein [Oceaniferula marina]NWK56988.1 MipA/OmpV family protein [Oceaniferula marina]